MVEQYSDIHFGIEGEYYTVGYFCEGLSVNDCNCLKMENPYYLYIAILNFDHKKTAYFGSGTRHEEFMEAIRSRKIKAGEENIILSRAQAHFTNSKELIINQIILHELPGTHMSNSYEAVAKMFELIDPSLLSPDGVYICYKMNPFLFFNPRTRKLSTFGRK